MTDDPHHVVEIVFVVLAIAIALGCLTEDEDDE